MNYGLSSNLKSAPREREEAHHGGDVCEIAVLGFTVLFVLFLL